MSKVKVSSKKMLNRAKANVRNAKSFSTIWVLINMESQNMVINIVEGDNEISTIVGIEGNIHSNKGNVKRILFHFHKGDALLNAILRNEELIFEVYKDAYRHGWISTTNNVEYILSEAIVYDSKGLRYTYKDFETNGIQWIELF